MYHVYVYQGATKEACDLYAQMKKDMTSMDILSWTDPSFSLDPFDLIFLPGGHEKGVVQVINSPIVHQLIADYFPKTKKPSRKSCAAICHGVMVLSESSLPGGKSVIHDVTTTALPGAMEQSIFWGTRLFLGDYYKTYGASSDSVETSVRCDVAPWERWFVNNICVQVKKRLDDPKQYRNSLGMNP